MTETATDRRPCWRCQRPTALTTGTGLPYCWDCREREDSEAAGYAYCPASCPWCGGTGCPLGTGGDRWRS